MSTMSHSANPANNGGTPIQRIVIAIDGSHAAAQAARYGLTLARAVQAEVVFASVIDLPIADEMPYPVAEEERRLAEARSVLQRLEAEAAAMGVSTKSRVEEGEIVPALLRLATEERSDLIIAGTHGRRGVRRFVLGSVAEALAREAPCPVLLVRERQHASEDRATAAREIASPR